MNGLKTVEGNVVESFRLAKNDIIELASSVSKLSNNMVKVVDNQRKLVRELQLLKQKRIVSKVITSKKKTIFVASKDSNKLHAKNCVFAKNIKPKKRLTFRTKEAALNKGFKACECLKV